MFEALEGDISILVSKGVYKVCPLYKRGNALYAKVSTGFVRLYASGATSSANWRIDRIHITDHLGTDSLGRLLKDGGEQLRHADKMRLLNGPE